MSTYDTFVFRGYQFDHESKTLTLTYGYDNKLTFTETFRFDFEFIDTLPEEALAIACKHLFIMAGVSYYKMYLAPNIQLSGHELDTHEAELFNKTYQRGLGEFFYVNKIDPQTPIGFTANTQDITSDAAITNNDGVLIGIGGGKDSLVTAELLRDQSKVATWSLNHRSQLQPLIDRIDLPHYFVERQWDPQIGTLNQQDALNGHVPISAIIACVGTIVALLTGYKYHVVSNESSANEPNLTYQSVAINHQYSKSLEFEKDYQAILSHLFADSVGYFSFLRPLSELHIAKVFARIGFDTYKDVFSSCNRAFTHDQVQMFWCGECSKCAFVFLALTPFVSRTALEKMWGKNLLLDPDMDSTYRQLLGIEGDKPLDCVGEVKESRAAMKLAQQQYPELVKYSFDIPANYDYLALSEHSMPDNYHSLLVQTVN